MAEKKIVFYEDDATHARFRLQLQYDGIRQATFFKMIINSYIEKDPFLMEYIYKFMENKRSKRTKKKILKDVRQAKKISDDFGLNENEIKDIFDMIAAEDTDEFV